MFDEYGTKVSDWWLGQLVWDTPMVQWTILYWWSKPSITHLGTVLVGHSVRLLSPSYTTDAPSEAESEGRPMR